MTTLTFKLCRSWPLQNLLHSNDIGIFETRLSNIIKVTNCWKMYLTVYTIYSYVRKLLYSLFVHLPSSVTHSSSSTYSLSWQGQSRPYYVHLRVQVKSWLTVIQFRFVRIYIRSISHYPSLSSVLLDLKFQITRLDFDSFDVNQGSFFKNTYLRARRATDWRKREYGTENTWHKMRIDNERTYFGVEFLVRLAARRSGSLSYLQLGVRCLCSSIYQQPASYSNSLLFYSQQLHLYYITGYWLYLTSCLRV